jgi:hypothetical protein
MAIGMRAERSIRSAFPQLGSRLAGLFALAVTLLAAIGFAGCHGSVASNPLLRERVISIDAEALRPLLELTARLTGTPAAQHSQRLLDRIASCGELWAHFETLDSGSEIPTGIDLATLDCQNEAIETSELAALVRARRDQSDGFVSWPIGDDGRVELHLEIDPQGGLEIDGTVVPPSNPGVLSLFVPGSDPPAPPVRGPENLEIARNALFSTSHGDSPHPLHFVR